MEQLERTQRWAKKFDIASGYLLSIASTLTATVLRYAMQSELEEKSRMLLFIPAVLISAWYGGVGPGLVAIGLSIFFVSWLLIPPITNINFGSHADQVSMILFLIISIGIVFLAHRERSEKQRREQAQAELAEANIRLEDRVRERTKELETANKELEGFCYNVSHDLRTPARAIMGNARILIEDHAEELSEEAKNDLIRISNAASKLGLLVDALLTYARLAQNELKLETVSVSEVIEREVDATRKNSGTRIELTQPTEILIEADRSMVQTAIKAIVKNSVVYRKPDVDVQITVAAERSGSDVLIRFSDNGIGFESQYAERILEPFQRLHRDEQYPGVGIGLANVARILERHGGKVWCESTPAMGASIHLLFRNQSTDFDVHPVRLSA